MTPNYRYKIVLSLVLAMSQVSTQNISGCQNDDKKFRTLRLTVSSRRNQTGDWTDALTAQTTDSKKSNSSDVDVIHTAEECQGNRLITIKGVYNGISHALHSNGNNAPIIDSTQDISKRRLSFHPRSGKNVILLNGGRTVQKIIPDYKYTAVFTNRPLEDNEIFQVRIEKKNGTGGAIAIGVFGIAPEEIEIGTDMAGPDKVAYFFAIYHYRENRSPGKSITNLKIKSTDDINEGDTLSVMRSADRKLHLFYNGFIQDVPWNDVPTKLYGYFELRGNGYRASIVDP